MAHLFEELKLRDVALPNRIGVSPMCQYCCQDGMPTDWHLVHLGSRAIGGAGLVFTEAAAVLPEGRISPQDLGIWSDAQAEALARIVRFVAAHGSVPGIQLAHAGRKASSVRPWQGQGAVPPTAGGWEPVGPSARAFTAGYAVPRALTIPEIHEVTRAFAEAARRAAEAGFRVAEIHAAHGYLLHQFLSPLSNAREDAYGGAFDNRTRLLREVAAAVRAVWPERNALSVRLSCTDWVEGGWDLEQSVELARRLRPLGVDLLDCSSGGAAADARMPLGPGYQTAFAERIRREAGILTAAVGLITAPAQADHIIRSEQADLVLLAREMLRDPYWPMRAARELGQPLSWPAQYSRVAPAGTPLRPA